MDRDLDFFDFINNYSEDPDLYLDVPFVPTDDEVVQAMLDLGRVGPNDVLYDLGSGDGRILVSAARDRNARGIGVDIDPTRIAEAMEYAGFSGVEYLVDFIEEDLFDVDISNATVVTLYLLQSINVQLRPRLLTQLRPGSRVISHAFDMGDWRPDAWLKLSGANIFKWIIPAQIAGSWEWQDASGETYRLELQQNYQQVIGSAWRDGKPITWENAELRGEKLTLTLREQPDAEDMVFKLIFRNKKLHSVERKT